MDSIILSLNFILFLLVCFFIKKYNCNNKIIHIVKTESPNMHIIIDTNKEIVEVVKERLSIIFKILAFASSIFLFGLYLFVSDLKDKSIFLCIGCVIISISIVFITSLLQSILYDLSLLKITKIQKGKLENAEFYYSLIPQNIVYSISLCILISAIFMILPQNYIALLQGYSKTLTVITAVLMMVLSLFFFIKSIIKDKNNKKIYYIFNFLFFVSQLSFWMLCGFLNNWKINFHKMFLK